MIPWPGRRSETERENSEGRKSMEKKRGKINVQGQYIVSNTLALLFFYFNIRIVNRAAAFLLFPRTIYSQRYPCHAFILFRYQNCKQGSRPKGMMSCRIFSILQNIVPLGPLPKKEAKRSEKKVRIESKKVLRVEKPC